MKLKGPAKAIILLIVVGVAWLGLRHLSAAGFIPRPTLLKTLLPAPADDIRAAVLSNPGNVKSESLPSDKAMPACVDGNTHNCVNGAVQEVEIWAWNANMGLIYGVGGGYTQDRKGTQTSVDSLAAKNGVNITLTRQDDTGQMQADLLDTIQKLQSDSNASGTKFITIMGDGGAQFFQAINPKLMKYGRDYQLETVAVVGYSGGEDGFWGPKEWKQDPNKAKGGLVVGVLRDGDWNIAMKWAAQNNIPNNPDDKVYDPNALNWINADSYTKAAEMFVANTSVDLPIKDKLGNSKIHKYVDGYVTWTPGDVTAAKKRGGDVPLLTTAQSVFQMPAILVGIRKWDRDHGAEVTKLLETAFEGADQLRTNPAALQRGGEISQRLYKESGADPAYWVKYYRGVNEQDATGTMVHLGGSRVSNLADNLQAFGLSGGANLFAATYNTFGRIVSQQYPNLVPTYPQVGDILNTTYVESVRAAHQLPENNAEDIKVTSTAPIHNIEGRRNYAIQFRTGSADILPESYGVLNQVADDVNITRYIVAIHGHTDNTGTPEGNQELSMRRANSVREYLQDHKVHNTIRTYQHGDEEPVASNSTADGRAKNRRVEVVLGTAE